VVGPSSRGVRRRKAVSEASRPGSGQSSSSADDPNLPDTFSILNGGLLIIKLPVMGI